MTEIIRKSGINHGRMAFGGGIIASIGIMWMMAPGKVCEGVAMSLGIFVFFGWFMVIPMMKTEIQVLSKVGNDVIEDVKSMFLSQEAVDSRLHQQAKEYDTLCRTRVRLGGAGSAETELKKLSYRIASARDSFYMTYNLTWRLGFKMKNSIQDYVNLPIVHDVSETGENK